MTVTKEAEVRIVSKHFKTQEVSKYSKQNNKMASSNDDEIAPAPRLCHLIKWPDFDGYGFNLHAERSNPGQYIGKIDDESPAQMAGLREGDRIVEVNGVNISNENHRQVVERIKSNPQETRLLVVDPETDTWYKERDIVVKSTLMNVVYIKTPVPRPEPDSPRAKFHQSKVADPLEEARKISSMEQHSSSLSPSAIASSSLETSDYNDDSIEQLRQTPSSSATNSTSQAPVSPPMSPDSGKGDEELAQVVTIEAEINRQSPVNMGHHQEQSAAKRQPEAPEKNMQPDSLNDSSIKSSDELEQEQASKEKQKKGEELAKVSSLETFPSPFDPTDQAI